LLGGIVAGAPGPCRGSPDPSLSPLCKVSSSERIACTSTGVHLVFGLACTPCQQRVGLGGFCTHTHTIH
jgi:hypothetical protein